MTDASTGKEHLERVPVMMEISKVDPSHRENDQRGGAANEEGNHPGPAKNSTDQANIFRVLFFCLTFFTIGVVSNFRKLWEEGIGKLAAVYLVGLFGFIIWFGLAMSWVFFGGVHPPIVHP